ncbi:MAG: hypothetical protein ACREL7_16105 [Longimicrobiales bacterium]
MRSGRNTLAALVLAVLSFAACDDPAGVIQDNVEVVARRDAMSIRNGRDATIYYFAIDRELAAVVDWMACSNPDTCPQIGTADTKIVRYEDLLGAARSGEIVVFWWHLVQRESGWSPDQLHSLLVRVGE